MKLYFTLFSLLVAQLIIAQQEQRILGQWISEDSTQIVQIEQQDSFYIGKLVHLAIENSQYLLDVENDNEQLRTRKLIGASVWTDFIYLTDKDQWKYGTIYNYKNGNTYNGKIQIDGDVLKLTGHYGFFFFLAKTQKWYRYQ